MSADDIFSIANTAVLPGWLVLLVVPRAPWTQRVVTVTVVVMGLVYLALFASQATRMEGSFGSLAGELGLSGEATLRYRPRVEGSDPAAIVAELRERRASDVERGHSTRGPHLDEIEVALGGRAVRRYGSQGQQLTALLALLFAERELLSERRGRAPLMLLDDVMSELDADRRELLAELLRSGGQALVTATERTHVPGAERMAVEVESGRIHGPSYALAA